jgi:hypothetical protein
MSEATKKALLAAYSILDELYMNGCVKQIRGRPAYDRGNVLSVSNPRATYVPLAVDMADPKLLPFAFGQDPVVLMPKVLTPVFGEPSTCKYDLWGPDARGGNAWKRLSQDVVLTYQDAHVATNPDSMAQAGNKLFLADYDSKKVYIIGANELNGLSPGSHELYYAPFDLSAAEPSGAGLPAAAKGQDIICMKGPDGAVYVFALFIDYTPAGELSPTIWGNSILVMMKVNAGGTLDYITKVSVGLNAQEIIPVVSDSTSVTLLIPCYGGTQNAGVTNGRASRIDMVKAVFAGNNMTAATLITGDAAGTAGSQDIRSLAARLGGGWLYILCGTMNNDAEHTQNWTIYKADLAKLLAIEPPEPPATYMTLSEAVSGGIMEVVDTGSYDPGFYWDICIEAGIDITGDRLWFLKGSSILITGAEEYNNDVKNFSPGYGIGETGGVNVNCVAFIAETLRQAAIGMSAKRGLCGTTAPIVSAAAQGQTQKY